MSLQLVWTIVNDIGDYHDIFKDRFETNIGCTAAWDTFEYPPRPAVYTCIVAELINDPAGPGQEVLSKRFLDILSQEDVIIT